MSLTIPNYIKKTNIAGQAIKYTWNEDDVNGDLVTPRFQQFYKICPSGIVAIAAGMAEWIIWRFESLGDTTDAKNFVEAVWAGLIDPCYLKNPKASWTKPKEQEKSEESVYGPLNFACSQLSRCFCLFYIKSNGVIHAPISLTYAGRLVLPKKNPFEVWVKEMLTKQAKLYPRQKDDLTGPPVPRQALEPDFDIAKTDSYLKNFLQNLDYKNNPYLNSPEEMVELGFKGKPYTFKN